MGNMKARLEKLERLIPKEPLFILITDPCDDIPLTPEEEAILEVERLRLKESKNPLAIMKWSRKEAQGLGTLTRREG
jgi:hypothetical protein